MRTVPAMLLILGLSCGPVLAQGLDGPAETPDDGFAGQQYVDSRGCVFVRADMGGQVAWVPRVGANRQPLCGYPPSALVVVPEAAPVAVEGVPPAEAPSSVAPAPSTPVPEAMTGAPDAASPTPAPATGATEPVPPTAASQAANVEAAPLIAAPQTTAPMADPSATEAVDAPLPQRRGRRVAVAPAGRVACPPAAPLARRFALEGGGTTVLCLPPGAGAEAGVAPSSAGPGVYAPADRSAQDLGRMAGTGPALRDRDGRRFVILAQGRVVPVEGVLPQSVAAAPATYVQVGAFGVAANAARAGALLRTLGLPVAGEGARLAGQPVQVVLAGPFADPAAAAGALAQVRQAGFGDAFLRQ